MIDKKGQIIYRKKIRENADRQNLTDNRQKEKAILKKLRKTDQKE